ncbi:MAG: hypothetical protein LBU47_03320 [Christensenellaceae bacterium]|jgi:penicillin-binding protein 2|nr:hypothetical protein [Christensenellaceae bacterium]
MEIRVERARRRRYVTVAVLVALFFAVIVGQLALLQMRDGAEYYAMAESKKNKTYTLKGRRGMILDRNGVVLAYDRDSYDVEFYRDPSRRKAQDLLEYTQSLLRIVQIVESHGGHTISGFSLKKNEEGESYFDFLTTNQDTFAAREKLWRGNFYVSSVKTEDLFATLVARYGIEDEDYDTQLKLLSLWQQIQMNAFLAKPVKIAINVDFNTVAEISAAAVELTGVSIAESSYRVYPRGTTASHILGYTGSISDERMQEYTAKGYSADDRVGVAGIESTMEDQLTGSVSYRQGKKQVEVNANGAVTRELAYIAPMDGNNVVTTIDINLQRILEESLATNIQQARDISVDQIENNSDAKALLSYYEEIDKYDLRPIELAQSGAAVVMDVKTGEILAMCSFPDYNPNDFIRGMTTEEYSQRYNIPTAPLLNRAISAKAAPGSVFKMTTALAGLMEGVVTVGEQINSMDEAALSAQKGHFILVADDSYAPKCWKSHHENAHQHMNAKQAIIDSCNYYFYNVTYRLGIDKLVSWASRLGLTSPTGVELPGEVTGSVGNQNLLYDSSLPITGQRVGKANIVGYRLLQHLNAVSESLGRTLTNEEGLERTVKRLMDLVLVDGDDKGIVGQQSEMENILRSELGLSTYEIHSHGMINTITNYLREIKWNLNETVLTGIGQSITELTPIGVARYVSAIANGGTVLQAQIVDSILASDGKIVLEKTPVVVEEIAGAETYLELIRDGMHGVISAEDGGTAARYWDDYPAQYKQMIGAKTGTAQKNQIDLENNAWFVGFTPFEEPEIAIAVFIENGYKGASASLTCQNVFRTFLEQYQDQGAEAVMREGELLP